MAGFKQPCCKKILSKDVHSFKIRARIDTVKERSYVVVFPFLLDEVQTWLTVTLLYYSFEMRQYPGSVQQKLHFPRNPFSYFQCDESEGRLLP